MLFCLTADSLKQMPVWVTDMFPCQQQQRFETEAEQMAAVSTSARSEVEQGTGRNTQLSAHAYLFEMNTLHIR